MMCERKLVAKNEATENDGEQNGKESEHHEYRIDRSDTVLKSTFSIHG